MRAREFAISQVPAHRHRCCMSQNARAPDLPPAGKGFTSAKGALASRRQAGQRRLMGQWLKLSLKTE